MIFLVTSHFQNSHKELGGGRLITRMEDEAPSNELQYDAGEFISIGRENGKELSADFMAQKRKGSPEVVLIGHLNAAGRLLDPEKQWPECREVLANAATAIKKEINSMLTQKAILNTTLQADEIKNLEGRIGSLNRRRDELLKLSKLEKSPTLAAPSPPAK